MGGILISLSMKLLSTLPLAALGQSFYDYYDPNSAGKFGALQVVTTGGAADNYGNEGASPNNSGHGGNKRYCHSTGHNQTIYNWTNNSAGGYFKNGRNVVECVGEELYCFIEERAQFGQIIGITAGCEQMMNHPAVTIVNQQGVSPSEEQDINAIKNNYNQEAARGGVNFHGLKTFYGIGGCLSMPAQNGHEFVSQAGPDQTTGTDSSDWTTSKWNNYYRFFHGGFGQNQCLRFPKMNSGTRVDSPGNLLPFGVSVCRACCVAEFLAVQDNLILVTLIIKMFTNISVTIHQIQTQISIVPQMDREKSLFHDSIWQIKHKTSIPSEHLTTCSFTMAAAT